MGKFRKKPVVIEAKQYTPGGQTAIEAWMIGFDARDKFAVAYDNVLIVTLEGTMKASHGDWIIRGVNGEFYPCKPDIFEKTYEAVEDDNG